MNYNDYELRFVDNGLFTIGENAMAVYVTKSLAMNREEAGALVFVKGKLLGAIIRIRDGKEITLGRDAVKSDVVISSKTISRLHCKLTYHRDTGKYTVIDYSKNGVYMSEGRRLPYNEEVEIESGEKLWIGDDENILMLG